MSHLGARHGDPGECALRSVHLDMGGEVQPRSGAVYMPTLLKLKPKFMSNTKCVLYCFHHCIVYLKFLNA